MSTPFSRSLRSLDADGSRPAFWRLFGVALLLALWTAWFVLGQITLYAATDTGRLEAAAPGAAETLQAVAYFTPQDALGHIRPGQSARLRLAGFPWTQYGSILATVTDVASERGAGRVRVELRIRPDPTSAIPLLADLPGTIEVATEQISPAALVLRAAGQWFAGRDPPPGGTGGSAAPP